MSVETFQRNLGRLVQEESSRQRFCSISQVARTWGVLPATLHRWLYGSGYPATQLIEEICERAECSMDWLVRGKGER